MELLRAVADTNIFVSGILNDKGAPAKFIEYWERRLFDLVVCATVFEEYQRVFSYINNLPSEQVKRVLELVQRTALIGEPSEPIFICKDPTDNQFLQCAIAGKARYLISNIFLKNMVALWWYL
ncbi:MAG: putative toxin-antitoxin system toxin component, PIN family [candidate division KSB1 bacterium]|nr:putative toxin-antitoxin system toxin component, PIN family [candidate division KSB1 bacterium]